ncbi:uncharacterized protein [Arachis hypogaea]|uniref:uncharacterized protein n=1 Tax=Arachis hypogaea TaxID=3818 RepID=UPI003B20CFA9
MPMYECEHCNALYWYAEKSNKSYNTTEPKFTLCCKGGKVQLPQLQEAPRVLYDLLYNNTPKSKHFRDNIKAYNSMFQFTSMGAKIDRGRSQARGPPTFILCGENYHLMGNLIPPEGNIAKFSQLYVFDTQDEIETRMGEHHKEIHEDIVRELKQMLDDNNVLVKAFRMVRDSLTRESNNTIKLRLLDKREKDGRRYNLPNTDEVAALIVGDFDINKTDRDIVVETQSGRLQRINQLNPAYLGLQYPLLFPFGEDSYKEDIPFNKGNQSGSKGRHEVSLREFFAFRIQERTFKAKLDLMIKDIRANKIFGRVCAVVYTIEFQKRGLPHAHILLFLHKDDKFPTAEDIDKIISAEIPDKELDPEYFEAVEKHMIHGPCVYRRKEDVRTINKYGVDLDSRYVVPHNRLLLMRYGAHINVEWCNQSRSIKYLIKYVNKGHDHVTASFYRRVTADAELDEYDENVIFKDHENLEDVVRKASVKESMFLGWFEANKDYAKQGH